MKRMIKYYDSIGDGKEGLFSTCSTKYEVLGLYSDKAGFEVLTNYAAENGLELGGIPFEPKWDKYFTPQVSITHSVKLTIPHTNTRWGKEETKPVFLGLVDLTTFRGSLKPQHSHLNVILTVEEANNIVNMQEYGVSSTGETVDGLIVLVKSGWEYYHQLPLLGYSLESFETAMGVTEHGFEDDTFSCHECGIYDSNDNGYAYNFRIVQECTLLGVNCGCYSEFCESPKAIEEYRNNPKQAMELNACEELEARGKLKHVERYIGGMVDGRGGSWGSEQVTESTPVDVLASLKAQHPKRDYLFSHDESGQFQTYFSVWRIASEGKRFKVSK